MLYKSKMLQKIGLNIIEEVLQRNNKGQNLFYVNF